MSQKNTFLLQESVSHEDAKCTGRCKAVVRRIVEQVRAETEQWSQMQGMLLQVRKEMEELQNSRKFWEDQALNSDREVQCLQSSVSISLFLEIVNFLISYRFFKIIAEN